MSQVKITQVRGTIDRPEVQKRTIKALGLGKINKSVVREASPALQGMLNKVSHLLAVLRGTPRGHRPCGQEAGDGSRQAPGCEINPAFYTGRIWTSTLMLSSPPPRRMPRTGAAES